LLQHTPDHAIDGDTSQAAHRALARARHRERQVPHPFMTHTLHGFNLNTPPSPEIVVQRQLDAYNARDLDALLATYAEDARQFEHPGILVASGHAQIRERMAVRFQEPNLHARLIKRAIMGNVVIDYEDVSRTFPEGTGRIELVAIYEIREGKIRTASIVVGMKTLDTRN
jgi:hypothetical protein